MNACIGRTKKATTSVKARAGILQPTVKAGLYRRAVIAVITRDELEEFIEDLIGGDAK